MFEPRFSRNPQSGIRFSKLLCCSMENRLGGALALPARLGLQAPGRAAHRSSQSLSPGGSGQSGQEALLSRQGSLVLLYASHGSGWTALK